jgi:predicted Zn-dependent peptidase
MDMFLHSTFDRQEIEKERGVIKEELAMYLDQPHQHVQELLNETLWPDHPLGRPLTGNEKTIDSLARPDLLDYQRENYTAASTFVIAAGNLTHQNVVRAVTRYAREFLPGKRPQFVPVHERQKESRLRLFTRETAQMQIAIGIRTCSRHDERRFSLRLLNTLLGDNMSSRLFQALREDHGLAYSVHSGLSYFDDVGTLIISAGLDTDRLPQALKLIIREVRRFSDTAPTAREMREARDYLVGQIDLSLENTESQMMWLGDQLLGYDKVILPSEVKRRLCDVKAGQVRQVAREFFRPERLNMAVVSPLKSASGFAPMFKL